MASVVTARFLGSSDFGKLGIVLATANLFAAMGATGLGITATKHVAEYRYTDPERVGRIIGLSSAMAAVCGLVATVILLSLAPWVARDILLAPSLVRELRLSALILFFAAYNGYQAGALAGFEAFGATAAANLIRGLVGFPFLVAGAVYGGLAGAVIANGLVTGLSCGAHAYMLRRQCRMSSIKVSYGWRGEELRLFYRFSLPVVLSGISFAGATWLCDAALARGAGYRENGLFQVGLHWQTLGLFLSNGVASVSLPMLASNLDSRRRYLQTLAGNSVLMVSLNMIVALPAILLAPWIAQIYGTQFTAASGVIQVMSICSILHAANISINHIIWSLGRATAGLVFTLLRAGILVALAYLLVPHGAIGLAWAYALTALILNLVQLPFVIASVRRMFAASGQVEGEHLWAEEGSRA